MSHTNDSGCWFDRSSLMVLLLGVLGAFLFSRPMVAAQASAAASAQGTETDSAWVLSTSHFDNRFEAEPYVGNGYIGLRIPAAGMGFLGDLGKVGWPLGTERVASAIAAGVYAKVADGTFYHDPKEAIALIPTWSTLTFADASGAYSPATASASNVSGYHQALDLRTGIVTTSGTWTSPSGHKTRFLYRVGTDRARGDIAVVTLEVTPMWTGTATVSSVLDGAGARRMDAVSDGVDLPTQTIYLNTKAKGTNIPVAESATLHSSCVTSPAQQSPQISGTAAEDVTFHAQAGRTCTFVKYVAVVTGRESAAPEAEARKESQQAARREFGCF